MSIDVDYENPWFFEGVPFLSENINDNFGFVYLITNIQNNRKYIGRKYFWSFRTENTSAGNTSGHLEHQRGKNVK
jgi:hypothetical protein